MFDFLVMPCKSTVTNTLYRPVPVSPAALDRSLAIRAFFQMGRELEWDERERERDRDRDRARTRS